MPATFSFSCASAGSPRRPATAKAASAKPPSVKAVRRPRPARVPLLREIMPVYSLSCRLVRLSGLHAIDRHRGLGLVLADPGVGAGRDGRTDAVSPRAYTDWHVALWVGYLPTSDGVGVAAHVGHPPHNIEI